MRRFIVGLFLFFLIAVLGAAYWLSWVKPVIDPEKQEFSIFLEEPKPFSDLIREWKVQNQIQNELGLRLICLAMDYDGSVKEGHYALKPGTKALDLVRKFRAGNQDPVRITFNGIRLREELGSSLSKQLALDSTEIMELFKDQDFLDSLGFRVDDALCVFIPNTYEVYWTITPKMLFHRMKKEYDVFWNESRRKKAMEAGLIPVEVSILASIVQQETNKVDEMSRVAGVYINRLNRGMPLQADPTVKFATRNFGARRMLTSDLSVSSPYNTYLVTGLPPGPICLPEPQTIDKVLNFEHHSYLFLCARPDYSGYHHFSKTGEQHARYATQYQRWLTSQGIYR